ncbi:MAG TPA: DUF6504 family protein [Candidatus Baltobacteraceae bacterium]|nr:DUF6504 family protein [Candidatus Baltobacteraceae bacterium]
MSPRFISEALVPGGVFDAAPVTRGEPALPARFAWHAEVLRVCALRRAWRSTKTDRGDVYLKRHWFELELEDGRNAVVYFDRQGRRGEPRWWLYTLEDPPETQG